MKNALVLAGYTESFERGRTPGPKEFVREVYFDHRCALGREFDTGEKKFAYVDFVVRCPSGRLVFLEVDEWQHESYPQLCETTRMANICASIALAGEIINVFWLRFHPDRQFQWKGTDKRVKPSDRQREVVDLLDKMPQSSEDQPMEIAYAFYDSGDGVWPDVMADVGYSDDVKPAVVSVHSSHDQLRLPWKPQEPWPRQMSDQGDGESDEVDEDEGEIELMCIPCEDDQPGSSSQHASMP
eukprot:5228546-Prymnesium_polylepis.2